MTDYESLIVRTSFYDETAADAIRQLVREREALLRALCGNCCECKHFCADHEELFCGRCFHGTGWEDKWEWIGVDEE